MRIAWFTPFSSKSAIGKYSKSVTNELTKHCEVDLWVSDRDELLQTNLKICCYKHEDSLGIKLKDYDHIVYNIGDCLDYHKDIYEISKKIPGIVIMHDFVMHHFFVGYYSLVKKSVDEYVRTMESLYGEKGRIIAVDSMSGKIEPIFETDKVVDYPFFEKAIENARGVVVHSRFQNDKVSKRFCGPVKVISLPLYSYDKDAGKMEKTADNKPSNKVTMVTIGYVNQNKRIDKIIETIGEDKDLADEIIYIVIGPYDSDPAYYSRITSLIKKYGLENSVKLPGYVDDRTLDTYLKNADIFINLRMPAMEGASGSVLEEMSYGKPVIVTNTSCYSELPDDCVLKVNMDDEKADLYRHLKKLVNDENLRKTIGFKARSFVIENCSPEKYCKEFLDFISDVRSCTPVIDLIDKAGEELDNMGVIGDMGVVDKVTNEIFILSGKGNINIH